MFRKLALILMILFNCTQLFSAFEIDSFSARSASLANAFVAIADDSSAPFYNPAGLAQLQNKEIMSTYSLLYPGLDINTLSQTILALALPIPKQQAGFGLSLANLSLQNTYSESIYQLTYSQKLNGLSSLIGDDFIKNEFMIGGNVKLLRVGYAVDSTIKQDPLFSGNKNSISVATVDLGLLVKLYSEDLQRFLNIGVSVFNITQPDIGIKTADVVPRNVQIGTAIPIEQYKFMQNIGMNDPEISLELNIIQQNTAISFGSENSFLINSFG